jgi:hypothetical protein
MLKPRQGLIAALLIMSNLGVSGAAVAEKKCIKERELEADQVRYIETQLRVAALQCKNYRHADIPLLYNDFILENRPYLVRTQKPLKEYLARAGTPSVETYIVSVANRVSMESIKVNQFCNRAKLAAALSSKTANPLTLLSLMPVTYRRPAAYCDEKSG